MKKRLRNNHSIEDLNKIYEHPHDHRIYGHGHYLRVELTKMIGHAQNLKIDSIADLSCGNAEIAKSFKYKKIQLGDFAPGYDLCGPIEQTIDQIKNVDLFICSETIEHLDDPALVLSKIRNKSKKLLLSTPIDCWEDDNIEHLWAWDRQGVEDLLADTRWKSECFVSLDTRVFEEPYLFGIWSCK